MRVACLCTHVPYSNIPTASGRFSWAWLSAFSTSAEVELVVPANEQALSAPPELPSNVSVKLVPITDRDSRFAARCHYNMHGGVTPGLSALSGFLASDILEEAVRSADVVEIHMHHLLPLVAEVRRIDARIPVSAIIHDVMTDKNRNEARAATSLRRRIGSSLRAVRSAQLEASLINQIDQVLTFTHKDELFLRRIGVTSPIQLIDPPVETPLGETVPAPDPVVSFTGTMSRSVNAESIRWFLDQVWPRVSESVSEARLVIAGADPPDWLVRRSSHRIRVTGYVEDFDAVYRSTSVFVAPLITGAGVKFKVLDAMAYGLPVVATPLAAEGIVDEAGHHCFGAVTADPALMAERIAFLLREGTAAAAVGARAREWVRQRFDFEQSTKRVLATYATLSGVQAT